MRNSYQQLNEEESISQEVLRVSVKVSEGRPWIKFDICHPAIGAQRGVATTPKFCHHFVYMPSGRGL